MAPEDGRYRYQCYLCAKRFSQKNLYQFHLRNHAGEESWECKTCSKTFFKKTNYIVHMRAHTEPNPIRPFVCGQCNHTFVTSDALNRHSKLHSKNPINCNYCKKLFYQRAYLTKHLKVVHGQRKKYTCVLCAEASYDAKSYAAHMKTHNGGKPFECEFCKKRYVQRAAMEIHIGIVHKREQPSVCEICRKEFGHINYLKMHLKNRPGEQPLSCPYCDRKFCSVVHFARHEKEHTGKKSFQCHDCRRTFIDKKSVACHIKACKRGQATGKPKPKIQYRYKCRHCPYTLPLWEKNKFLSHLTAHTITNFLNQTGIKCHFKCFTCDFITLKKELLDKHIFYHRNALL